MSSSIKSVRNDVTGAGYALLKEMEELKKQVGGDYEIESSEGTMTLDEYIDTLKHGRK